MSARRDPGFLAGLIVGGLLGTGLGLLLAPRSGSETRGGLARWRADRRALIDPTSPFDELLDLGAAAFRAAIERVEAARLAGRAASESTERQLTAEWEQRKRGG